MRMDIFSTIQLTAVVCAQRIRIHLIFIRRRSFGRCRYTGAHVNFVGWTLRTQFFLLFFFLWSANTRCRRPRISASKEFSRCARKSTKFPFKVLLWIVCLVCASHLMTCTSYWKLACPCGNFQKRRPSGIIPTPSQWPVNVISNSKTVTSIESNNCTNQK